MYTVELGLRNEILSGSPRGLWSGTKLAGILHRSIRFKIKAHVIRVHQRFVMSMCVGEHFVDRKSIDLSPWCCEIRTEEV